LSKIIDRSRSSTPAAEFQVARVAAARRTAEDNIRKLVEEHTELRQFGFLGSYR
jgi:K+-transporting ATPase ATPase C chain